MSDLKVHALAHAVQVTKTPEDALAAAKKFHAFLAGESDASSPGKPATPGKPAATGKAATATAAGTTPEAKAAARLAAKQAAEKAAQDAADAEAAGGDEAAAGTDAPTKEAAAAAIKSLVNAGLRPAAKELLAEFGAEALSGLAPSDYAAFIEKANDLLVSA